MTRLFFAVVLTAALCAPAFSQGQRKQGDRVPVVTKEVQPKKGGRSSGHREFMQWECKRMRTC